jgi:hypothetical protein
MRTAVRRVATVLTSAAALLAAFAAEAAAGNAVAGRSERDASAAALFGALAPRAAAVEGPLINNISVALG